MMTITLLVENTARGMGVLGEHGLAWWIDTGSHRVLFDTGQGMALRHNADRLGIDLSTADAIVLSHGHYDHVGGLELVLEMAPKAILYLHPRAVEPKYTGSDRRLLGRRISTRFVETQAFRRDGRKIVETAERTEVVPGVWTTGEIPRETDFEDTGGPFFLDEASKEPDPLLDDISMFLPTPTGTVVIFGCAHSGAVNTLYHISRLTGGAPVRAAYGGLHLENASAKRMDATMTALRSCGAQRLGFCHCTGFKAVHRLWSEFPDACVPMYAGIRIEL